MTPTVALLLGLVLGSHVGAALTVPQMIQLGVFAVQQVPKAIQVAEDVDAIMHTPSFRSTAAANGLEAIRLQPGIVTER